MKKIIALLAICFAIGTTHASAQAKTDTTTKSKSRSRAKTTTPATTTTTTPATTTTTTPAKPAAVNPPNKSADKAVGTDAKGRTIYEGPRGGRYVLTAKGNKEYLKKTN